MTYNICHVQTWMTDKIVNMALQSLDEVLSLQTRKDLLQIQKTPCNIYSVQILI